MTSNSALTHNSLVSNTPPELWDDSDLPSDIVDLEKIAKNPNILVFSKPKAGKTTWACSDDRILLLNCEVEGEISASSSAILGNHVKQWKVIKYQDFQKAIEWLRSLVEKGKPIPFRWIVVDTLTTLQDRQLMRYIMDNMLEKKPQRNKFIPDKPEYYENQLTLVNDVKTLCDLPIGVIFLAHTMQQTDPEGEDFYYPQLQGGKIRVAQQVLSFMTSYGYMYVKTRTKDGKVVRHNGKAVKDRIIMWEDYKAMQGGDRTNVLGQYTQNVTLREIRGRMEAKAKELEGK